MLVHTFNTLRTQIYILEAELAANHIAHPKNPSIMYAILGLRAEQDGGFNIAAIFYHRSQHEFAIAGIQRIYNNVAYQQMQQDFATPMQHLVPAQTSINMPIPPVPLTSAPAFAPVVTQPVQEKSSMPAITPQTKDISQAAIIPSRYPYTEMEIRENNILVTLYNSLKTDSSYAMTQLDISKKTGYARKTVKNYESMLIQKGFITGSRKLTPAGIDFIEQNNLSIVESTSHKGTKKAQTKSQKPRSPLQEAVETSLQVLNEDPFSAPKPIVFSRELVAEKAKQSSEKSDNENSHTETRNRMKISNFI